MRLLCIAIMAWIVGAMIVRGAPGWVVLAFSVPLWVAVAAEVRRYVLRRLRAAQRAAWLSWARCDVCAKPASAVWDLSSSRGWRVQAQACPEHVGEVIGRFVREIGR